MSLLTSTTSSDNLSVVPLWINGKPLPIEESDAVFPVIASKKSTTLHNAVSASPAHATLACDTAATAFTTWRRTTPAYRRSLLLKAADLLWERREDIMTSQMDETSCPRHFAEFNIKTAVEYVRENAAATVETRGDVGQQATDEKGLAVGGLTITVREAVGVVCIIPPWNGAVILPLRAMSMALAAGCTLVVKASELCPRTHHLLVETLEAAGIPAGVINVIQARRADAAPVVEAIVSHKALRKVDFIGSAAVGKQIGQVCAKYLKPVLMELGGKGPAIVCEDADLGAAARLCAMGAILDHGQLCFSTERVIVHKSVSSAFIPLFKAAMESIPTTGDAVTVQSIQHAYDVLADAESKGAKFLIGGLQHLTPTSLKPTIVTNVSPDARIIDEETFGPSCTLYIAESDEEAIRIANDSAYGLNAAVHSKSWEHAYSIARELEYGQVQINSMTVGDSAGSPIRGVKGSGWGCSNSVWGIREFQVEKTVSFHASAGGRMFIEGAGGH